MPIRSQPLREVAAIVEATDIPILSATDRLQRALLRWVDMCGISGQYRFSGGVEAAMDSCDMLDDRSFILGIIGGNPVDWPVVWSGQSVAITAGQEFGPAFQRQAYEPRLLSLMVQEYSDAVRYRRAAARRFSLRSINLTESVDQLIFPLRDESALDYVLVRGELVSGDLLYDHDDVA